MNETYAFPMIEVKARQLGCVPREREENGKQITVFHKRLKNDGGPPTVFEVVRIERQGDECDVYMAVLVPADDDVISYGFKYVRGTGLLVAGDLSQGKLKFTATPEGTAYIEGDVVPFSRHNNDDMLPIVEVQND